MKHISYYIRALESLCIANNGPYWLDYDVQTECINGFEFSYSTKIEASLEEEITHYYSIITLMNKRGIQT